MKKLLSVFLVFILCIGISLPANAAEYSTYTNETISEFDGKEARAGGQHSGYFDEETIIGSYYFLPTNQAIVCRNDPSSAGAVQFRVTNSTPVGVPPGSGYSFLGLAGAGRVYCRAIEVWGWRVVSWANA